MFPDNMCQNIDILVVINVQKNSFGFYSNRKTQGQKHQVNNLYFKYQVCQMKLRHLNTFLQFRLLFHEPHCSSELLEILTALIAIISQHNCHSCNLPLMWFALCFCKSNLLIFVTFVYLSIFLSVDCPSNKMKRNIWVRIWFICDNYTPPSLTACS